MVSTTWLEQIAPSESKSERTCATGAQSLTVRWDKLMGTWRDPEEAARSGEVPDGVLR